MYYYVENWMVHRMVWKRPPSRGNNKLCHEIDELTYKQVNLINCSTKRENKAYGQGRIKSLRGPRPVFSARSQSTEKCGVWV
jgi:hypothetical protein